MTAVASRPSTPATKNTGLTATTLAGIDFKVADLSKAELGRHEIRLAEHEMPGLMALRTRYAGNKPLKGARISGCHGDDNMVGQRRQNVATSTVNRLAEDRLL